MKRGLSLIEENSARRTRHAAMGAILFVLAASPPAFAATWRMKHRDAQNTGRANYVVPAERLNDTFFDFPLWQTRAPGSPNDGHFSGSAMVFFDEAGPNGEDMVAAGYHWPKGVQAMNRHTGKLLWTGNPGGGETIGRMTPAFSNDGLILYVTNDATEDATWPMGHPLMAFYAFYGPSFFWHNGADANPAAVQMMNPILAPDGRVFLHQWVDRPSAAADNGVDLNATWTAGSFAECGYSDVALFGSGSGLRVVVGTRGGDVVCYHGQTGAETWRVNGLPMIDAPATIDAANGRIYVPAGTDSVSIVGLSTNGDPLWSSATMPVFNYLDGVNNPQRAQSAGCLSWDGATYYFSTVSQQADGGLYAINTADGTVKWFFGTSSHGWEGVMASPIVTRDGTIIVGANDNDGYAAFHDDGASPTLLDVFFVDGAGNSCATPTLAPDGRLYLPLRTSWIAGNGDGEIPNGQIENLFTCFDITATATYRFPPPADQRVFTLNGAVDILWTPVSDPAGRLDHYKIYRSTGPFTDVSGMTPVATVQGMGSCFHHDQTIYNGVSYFYAVTSVASDGSELKQVSAIGPRTPFDETDLQVACITRAPTYPRYCAAYADYEVTEPSGFGPYYFSASFGIDCGQDSQTQRFPNIGDPMTYTATIRNRGTNVVAAPLHVTWLVDGLVTATDMQSIDLAPNGVYSFDHVLNWDGQSHEVRFRIDMTDARAANNEIAIDTKSVSFMSYIDRTHLEKFREESLGLPFPNDNDLVDWLNNAMAKFNQMFAAAGTPKRVHFNILQVLDDVDPTPGIDQTHYAIFPLRYTWNSGTLHGSGYYDAADDIDYGLLHEMGHQLGLIDLYQLDLSANENDVSGLPYTAAPACLMHGVSHSLSQHSALGMTHWQDKAHGYYGQYLYGIPTQVRMRFTDMAGQPLSGVDVKMYQMCARPAGMNRLTTQVKAQGVTDADGYWTLPNVPIDHNLVPTTEAGDMLNDNPFGYVAVVGHNGLLHFAVDKDGFTDYAWLDITECNVAYYTGQTTQATFTRALNLGGPLVCQLPPDMTENNASSWFAHADSATATVFDDATRVHEGLASIRFETDGGFDTSMRYGNGKRLKLNLTGLQSIRFWAYAENPSPLGFQEYTPWVRIGGPGGYFELRSASTLLNAAIGQWHEFVVPFAGDAEWYRQDFGAADLADIRFVELHFDTWDYGFTLWIDGLFLDPRPAAVPGDANGDCTLSAADVPAFVLALLDPAAYAAAYPDCDARAADMNGDSLIDGDDISPFVAALFAP